ncbi:MAG: cell division protein FtsA, partial [Deltaproteobacteria bacterium]|nr:cell division protein FtsA [Deltaproteobacteria bacterium]
EGAISYTASLPLGGNQVTNDIAIGLRTPMEAAERIKRHYGCTTAQMINQDESIEVPSVGGRPPRKLSRQILGEIIEPRLEEIFELANRELHKSGVYDQVVSGVVITGGTALLPGTAELAEKVFELQARVGFPEAHGSGFEAVNSPVYASAIGLLKYAAQDSAPNRRVVSLKGFSGGGFLGKLKDVMKDFF